MDTRFLESFVAVADHGSIAEAARRLKLTPSAVTQRIQALEQEMGAKLLMRSGRTVMPTEGGMKILDRARRFLHEVRDLKALANDREAAGELRIGAIATAFNGILPDILASLSGRYPLLSVYVVPGTSETLYPQVLAGELDGAIIVQPEFAMPKTCGWRTLRDEPLVVLTPRSMAVSDPIDALRSSPFVRYDRKAVGGRIADRFLQKAGISPRDRFELTSLTAIALMVDKGLGVSLVPDWAPPWPQGLSVNKLAVGGDDYLRRIGLLWNNSSARLRLVHAFLEQAAVHVQGPGGC